MLLAMVTLFGATVLLACSPQSTDSAGDRQRPGEAVALDACTHVMVALTEWAKGTISKELVIQVTAEQVAKARTAEMHDSTFADLTRALTHAAEGLRQGDGTAMDGVAVACSQRFPDEMQTHIDRVRR